MPIHVQCDDIAVTKEEVESLWHNAMTLYGPTDDTVTVRCVSEQEIQSLNESYRHTPSPTNVLTFSYGDGSHDVALCVEVASREAARRNTSRRDYTALLLAHAFLHVFGFDHERSDEETEKTAEAERTILQRAGFSASHL